MKRSSLILALVFLISTGVSVQKADAQEKTKQEKEKELRMQEAIDAQKKAMVEQQKSQEEVKKPLDETFFEQKKAQEEATKAMKDQQIAIEKAMQEVEENVDNDENLNRSVRVYHNSRGDRPLWSTGEAFNFSVPNIEVFNHSFGDSEKTTWDFSKTVRESSFSRDYTIDVEPNVNTVVMSVNGDCKDGEIRIKIIMPGGKTYSDILIDESGNLNYRKSFTISETENKEKAGEWKFEINSNKATGYFRISLQTY